MSVCNVEAGSSIPSIAQPNFTSMPCLTCTAASLFTAPPRSTKRDGDPVTLLRSRAGRCAGERLRLADAVSALEKGWQRLAGVAFVRVDDHVTVCVTDLF